MRLRPSVLLGLAVLALASAGLIGVVAYWTTPGRWVDGNALSGFASLSGSPVAHSAASELARSANTLPFAVVTVVLLAAALASRGPRRPATIALLLTGANVACLLLKPNPFPPRATQHRTS